MIASILAALIALTFGFGRAFFGILIDFKALENSLTYFAIALGADFFDLDFFDFDFLDFFDFDFFDFFDFDFLAFLPFDLDFSVLVFDLALASLLATTLSSFLASADLPLAF